MFYILFDIHAIFTWSGGMLFSKTDDMHVELLFDGIYGNNCSMN